MKYLYQSRQSESIVLQVKSLIIELIGIYRRLYNIHAYW